MSSDITFRLYSRSYCHLCEDMLNALMRLKPQFEFQIDIVDVDDDTQAEVLERYDEMVPVLTGVRAGAEEVYLCHYHFDADRVAAFLAGRLPAG